MAKEAKINLNFGVDIPESSRGSRYDSLYALLRENPGQWADVTDAVALLAQEANSKVPGTQATAITLRKKGFEATTRKVDGAERVFARQPEEGEEG